jgi:hypothetical protein
LAGPDVVNFAADLLDNANILVAHRGRAVDRFDAAVGPQVRTADASGGDADDRVGRLLDPGALALFDTDLPGGVENDSSHDGGFPFGWLSVAAEDLLGHGHGPTWLSASRRRRPGG